MSKSDGLKLHATDTRQRFDDTLELSCKIFGFGGSDFYTSEKDTRKRYFGNSTYRPAVSRVGYIGDQVVTHFGVWEYFKRIGNAPIRCAGIGAVCSHPDYRRRGLVRKTLLASLDACRADGYDMTALFGRWDFYDQFGYVRGWIDRDHTVQIDHLPDTSDVKLGSIRRFGTQGFDGMDDLYNQQHAELTGTLVRPFYRYVGARDKLRCRWVDGRHRTRGYVLARVDKHTLACGEAVGETGQIIEMLRRLAKQNHCSEIRFQTIPYLHPLMVRLRRGTCRVQARYIRAGDAMVRLLNLSSTLTRIKTVLRSRLSASPMKSWRGTLRIDTGEEQADLVIGPKSITVREASGQAKHAIRGGMYIAQLILGTHEPTETMEAAGMVTTGDAGALACVLFPQQYPMLSRADGY